jgi:glycine reductase
MLAKGNLKEVAKAEFDKVRAAGFDKIVQGLTKDTKKSAAAEDETEVAAPAKEVVTGSVSGIDIMDLEDAVKALWKQGVYAESGMGCTGPIVMVAEEKLELAIKLLAEAGFLAKEAVPC